MSAINEFSPRPNHVFVDFENIHEVDSSILGAKSVYFTLLLGVGRTRLDVGLVEKLLEHADSVQIIRLTSSGKNALDFALAYYVGRAVSANPAAFIHIVSKDKGFDPLVEHLRSRHIHAHRHDSFATLTFDGTPSSASAGPKPAVATKPPALPNPAVAKDDPLAVAVERLRNNVAARPKKRKTLLSHLKSQLGKDATEADAAAILGKLERGGHIRIGDKDMVTYHV